MKNIAALLFEANILKNIPRAGYHFLGVGKESVAEHSFSATFIAYVMSMMDKDIDSLRLISMCLIHDLPEARIGDQNYVQKKYVTADEEKAVADATRHLPFGQSMVDLIAEFNEQKTHESNMAYDADQLSFILDLKSIADTGHKSPDQWLPVVQKRLKTDIGKRLAEEIMATTWDAWWMDTYEE
jgi:putative hydrolase of HD superfamily